MAPTQSVDTPESEERGWLVPHSDLFLVLHVCQFHILRLSGGWGLLQMAANHELVHKDTSNGTEEWRDDGYPPPVPAGPGGQIRVIRGR